MKRRKKDFAFYCFPNGFELTNGHKEYKKLNSELKAAISMYRKNQNDSSSIIKKLKLIISFVFFKRWQKTHG